MVRIRQGAITWCRHLLHTMSLVRVPPNPHHALRRDPGGERSKRGNTAPLLDERAQLLGTEDEMAQQPVRRRIIG